MERGALAAWRLGRGILQQCTALSNCVPAGSQAGGLLSAAGQAGWSQQGHSKQPTPFLPASICKWRTCGLRTSSLAWKATIAPQAPEHLNALQDILQHVNIVKLRQELDSEGERQLAIPYSRFVEIAKACGANSDAEADEQCKVLQAAGVILKLNNQVYLKAEEVADMVMAMLPGGREDTQAKLAKVDAELAELDKVHELTEKRSSRRSDALLFCGLVILFTQFVGFIWLTWWELSWDVMEPIAYIISLFYSLVAYIYFMWSRHAFDLEPFHSFWSQRFKQQSLDKQQFDADRYEFLKKLQGRYKRHLRALR